MQHHPDARGVAAGSARRTGRRGGRRLRWPVRRSSRSRFGGGCGFGCGSRLAPGVLALVAIAGCASDLALRDGRYQNARRGYTIEAPGGPGPAWGRVPVKGADLAFRRPGPETISLQSRCGHSAASPAIMARHLMFGLPDRTLRQAGPTRVGDLDGWTQTFDTRDGDVAVRVKTVTAVARGCTFDWVLVAPATFEPAEQAFDAWWRSFQLTSSADVAAVR